MRTQEDFENWDSFVEEQGVEYRTQAHELDRRYGSDFLHFVCACDYEYGFHNVVPTEQQRTVVAEIYRRSEALAEIADHHERRIATARELGGYVDELASTRSTAWHRSCGGTVPDLIDDGSAESALQLLAGDLLGFRLLPTHTHINAVLDSHPGYSVLADRLAGDKSLVAIFEEALAGLPESDADPFVSHPWHATLLPLWSDGTSQTLQFHDLIGVFVTNARVSKYAANDCIGQVQAAAVADLRLARALSAGEVVSVPTYVGLAGVRLSDGNDVIGLEGMRLRRSTPLDPGCLNATTQVWTVLEVDTPFRHLRNDIQDSATDESGFPGFTPQREEDTEVIMESLRAQDDLMERLRFAFLLSSGPDEEIVTTEVFRVVSNPMVGASAGQPFDLPHNASAVELSEGGSEELNTWLPRVKAMPDQLVLSMRRLLRAAAERSDLVDSLIDAVVAWEGLFGANPEIKFQVTGAVCVLLEKDDMDNRAELKRKLGKIYDMRSSFVHGAVQVGDKKMAIDTVAHHASQAVSLGLRAFKEVLLRPDLAEIQESRLRAQKVLLGF